MSDLQCDGIIFDLDGVLVDSSFVIRKHWWNWAKKHGIDPEESLHATLGLTTADGIRLIAPDLDAEMEAKEIDDAEAKDTEGVVAYGGVTELIETIPTGWWGVATSGTKDTAMARIGAAGLKVPDVLISADDVVRGKPEPEPYLLAAEKMGLQPDRCLVVEDSSGGIRAGLAAGMRVIGVASTHTSDELEMADTIVKTIKEINVSVNQGEDTTYRMKITCQDQNQ
jgi:sugar-phosphatase